MNGSRAFGILERACDAIGDAVGGVLGGTATPERTWDGRAWRPIAAERGKIGAVMGFMRDAS